MHFLLGKDFNYIYFAFLKVKKDLFSPRFPENFSKGKYLLTFSPPIAKKFAKSPQPGFPASIQGGDRFLDSENIAYC